MCVFVIIVFYELWINISIVLGLLLLGSHFILHHILQYF